MALNGIVDVTGWIPAGLVVVVVRLLDSSVLSSDLLPQLKWLWL